MVHWPFNPEAAPLTEPPGVPPGALRDTAFYLFHNVPLAAPLPRLASVPGAIRYVLDQAPSYYTSLDGTFDDYLASFSSKTRSTLQRKVRKFAELSGGVIDLRVYRTPQEMGAYHALARKVAARTYQERLFDGAIPESPHFLSQIQALAAEDRVRGFLLFLNGHPIAYLHLPVHTDGTVEYEYLGYDPAHANTSPGTVLLFLALQYLFAEPGLRYFDFTYGYGQTKEVFSRGQYLRADIYYFAKTPYHYAAIYGHSALDSFSVWSGRLLERWGLKRAIKRLLRRSS